MDTSSGHIVSAPFPVDGHVHFYPEFERQEFLDSALANFRRVPGAAFARSAHSGCLLFAETPALDYFRRFRDLAGKPSDLDTWTFHETAETLSLVAQRDPDTTLLLVAGRQVVTTERVEVLTLCCDERFEGDRPLSTVVEIAQSHDAVVVLPWGFGKWSFRRGACIADFLKTVAPASVFLGDNGGRARLGPRPRLFRLAEDRGVGILSGSDPLPLRSEVKRVGGYGFLLPAAIDPLRPAAALKRLLQNRAAPPLPYGRLIDPMHFCRNQIMLRINATGQSSAR